MPFRIVAAFRVTVAGIVLGICKSKLGSGSGTLIHTVSYLLMVLYLVIQNDSIWLLRRQPGQAHAVGCGRHQVNCGYCRGCCNRGQETRQKNRLNSSPKQLVSSSSLTLHPCSCTIRQNTKRLTVNGFVLYCIRYAGPPFKHSDSGFRKPLAE